MYRSEKHLQGINSRFQKNKKNVCNFVLCGHNHSVIRFFSWHELLRNLNGKIDCAGDLVGFQLASSVGIKCRIISSNVITGLSAYTGDAVSTFNISTWTHRIYEKLIKGNNLKESHYLWKALALQKDECSIKEFNMLLNLSTFQSKIYTLFNF